MRIWKLHSKNLNNNQQNYNRFIEEEKQVEDNQEIDNNSEKDFDTDEQGIEGAQELDHEKDGDTDKDRHNDGNTQEADDQEMNVDQSEENDDQQEESNKIRIDDSKDELDQNNINDDIDPSNLDTGKEQNVGEEENQEDIELLDDFFDNDTDRSPGYDIVKKDIEVNDYIIKNVINKFINMRFYNTDSNLNSVSCSYNKARGFIEWDKKLIVKHLTTKQYNKILDDKYAYDYEALGSKNIPLSFYFDLSGSMASYSHLLTVIAKCLLDNGIKVLVGFNEMVKIQVNEVSDTLSIDEFQGFIVTSAGGNNYTDLDIDYDIVDTNLDEYLIDKRAEKCVLFTDYDAINECFNLSNYADIYWLCFRDIIKKFEVKDFNGFIYKVKSKNDIYECFLRMTSYSYEAVKSFGRVLK